MLLPSKLEAKKIEGQKILSEGKKWVIFLFSSFQVPALVPQNEPGGLAKLLPVSPAAGIEAPPKSAEKCVLQGVFFFFFFRIFIRLKAEWPFWCFLH